MQSWQALNDLVLGRLRGEAEAWWLRNTEGPVDRVKLLAALSGAGRRLGRDNVPSSPAVQALADAGLIASGRPWAELGRVGLLLLAVNRVPDDAWPGLLEEAYRTGDLSEKQAVLRALAHLPGPQRFVAIAAEGARANALSIFTAVACGNPFPAAHFADDRLNQLVMKALFNQVPLAEILGLPGRMNADLRRMARDYANERRAAGRPVSDDLAMLEGEGLSS